MSWRAKHLRIVQCPVCSCPVTEADSSEATCGPSQFELDARCRRRPLSPSIAMSMSVLFCLLVCLGCLSSALRICHHNDFHARYTETNRYNAPCSVTDSLADKCYSSVARLSTFFTAARCDLRVFAGDFVQGSVYDTLFGADIAIDMYRALKYDIATLGNHEFDHGLDPVYRTVNETGSSMVWIASNLGFSGGMPDTFPLHQAAVVDDLCWVAAVTPLTAQISSPGNKVTFYDPADSIKRAIPSCGRASAVIAVTHLGYDNDVALCSQVPELNLVIGGHSHSDLTPGARYPTKVTRFDGSTCYVVTAFAYGRYVGVLDVVTDSRKGFDFEGYQIVPMDYRVPRDPALDTRLRMKWDTSALVNQVVGTTTAPIDETKCRVEECEMGNLICDAMLAYAGPKQGAVACIENGGGLRASIDEGDITLYEELTVIPFQNVHVVITLSGKGLLNALEIGFSAIGDGRFPQVAGMIVDVNYKGIPGSRVAKVTIGGAPLHTEASYTIVMNDFIAMGGDGYVWEEVSNIELSGRGLDTLVSEYLANHNPYSPFTEGRISDISV